VLLGGAGSAGVGAGGAVSGFVSPGGADVGRWSSAGGAVGLCADGWVFLRFTVFLLTSSLSSWATFSPTYRLSQIADKALTFDGTTRVEQHVPCLTRISRVHSYIITVKPMREEIERETLHDLLPLPYVRLQS
jgi:hypothetical protein